jgi:tRNA1Val (adenine37-N6)-methyltransferase
MGRNNYFQFKQFKIVQQHSAMKVGTDGVLIGAWTNIENAATILDVGTGTGLIALMMAQRTNAQITAIEIVKDAAKEATENVSNSPWKERIEIENISFHDFVIAAKSKFDLIISNPPFFINSFKTGSENRTIARHNDLLPFAELASGAKKRLAKNGRLAIILPVAPAETFIEIAKNEGLNLVRLTKVKPKSSKAPNRFLMEFTMQKLTPVGDILTIYLDDNSDYTKEFKELIRDFYLYENKR